MPTPSASDALRVPSEPVGRPWLRQALPAVALALTLILGADVTSAIPGGAEQAAIGMQQAVNDANTIRIGRVVAFNTSNISVLFTSGASYSVFDNIAYLKTYRPILGEYVMVQKYASQWIVMGAMSYNMSQNNAVPNPSFESDSTGAGNVPDGWTWFHDTGVSTANSVTYGIDNYLSGCYDGPNAAYVSVVDNTGIGVKFSRDTFYSNVIPVTAGEQWMAAAGFSFNAGGSGALVNARGTVQLLLYFYTSPLDAVNASISSQLLDQQAQTSTTPGWYTLQLLSNTASWGVLVPPGANYMRVALQSDVTSSAASNAYGAVYYDGIVARKLTKSDGTYAH
jgi:hypothetical protein